ncbi:hypothetical protein C900_03294 [Fulvivirga imtechensis AK7]|uniref:Cadherin domain-containing protein n=1 Tax=Fulvivirga imtechensis AK7 TaxID=1237149 RepID=L8JTM0_9BACT|nr:cadherin domain-containing protein [Fulvivirga imtechensis]ELR70859.1 hypothetical protein C900_03294 [Fulvivirga imtechensis AK7]
MKKTLLHILLLLCCVISFKTNAFDCCPNADLIVSRITITNTPTDDNIQYEYELKNVGLDTMFLNRMLIQSYVSKDQVLGGDVAAGGAIFPSDTPYLLPGETYIGNRGSYPNTTTIAEYPYVIIEIKLKSGETMTECSTSNNIGVAEITTIVADADITAFSLNEQTSVATIDNTNHAIEIDVFHGTDMTNLTSTFTLSTGANASPASGVAVDFTCPAVFEVTSSAGNTQSWSVVVNEEPNYTPSDIMLDNTSVDENTATTTIVGKLSTTDGNTDQTHTYTLVAGTGDADNTSFSISGDQLLTAASFDFESKNTYSIRIKTNDGFGGAYEKAFTITVNDVAEAPTDIILSNTSIDENEASNTVVGTLTTTDEDNGDTFTYSLIAGSGGADNSAFSINGSELIAAESFDFEGKASYHIRIKTEDNGGNGFEKAFTITVSDVQESPTDISLSSASVNENEATGTLVGTLSSTDEDAGETFSYSLVAGNGDSDNSSFSIDGAELLTAESFDFESKSLYSVRIRTEDSGGNIYERAFDITVTDVNEVTTSLDHVRKQNIKLFPVPAKDKVSIEVLKGTEKPLLIQVINTSGQVVLEYAPSKTITDLDLSQLKKGIYTITVLTNNDQYNLKLYKK